MKNVVVINSLNRELRAVPTGNVMREVRLESEYRPWFQENSSSSLPLATVTKNIHTIHTEKGVVGVVNFITNKEDAMLLDTLIDRSNKASTYEEAIRRADKNLGRVSFERDQMRSRLYEIANSTWWSRLKFLFTGDIHLLEERSR